MVLNSITKLPRKTSLNYDGYQLLNYLKNNSEIQTEAQKGYFLKPTENQLN